MARDIFLCQKRKDGYSEMKIYDFRTEYRKEPFGLDVRSPRFSWKMESEETDTVQTAYRVRVNTGGRNVWDTGRRESDQSVLIPYEGSALENETVYEVILDTEDNHGNTAHAETRFATGIFDPETFAAKMITHDFPDTETACPVFYKDFGDGKTGEKSCRICHFLRSI